MTDEFKDTNEETESLSLGTAERIAVMRAKGMKEMTDADHVSYNYSKNEVSVTLKWLL